MTKILVGVEDSPRSRDAVSFARQLAEATGARIVLANAYPAARIPSRAISAEFEARLHADAEATLSRRRREAGAVDVETRALHDPSPARALHRLAADEDAALIVVGSSERGEVGRVLAGTTAERLLHGSPCPVAVVPEAYRLRARPVRRILVAYDGSGCAKDALKAAITLARPWAAAVRVLQVVPPVPITALAVGATYLTPPGEVAREARSQLDADIAAIEDGGGVQADVVLGDPVKVLAARSEDTDLLVIGSRGYGPHRAVMLGGVSGRVVRKAACPVLVLPRGGDAHLPDWLGEMKAAGTA